MVLEAPTSGAAVAKCSQRVYDALAPVFQQARETVIVGAQIKPPPRLIAELVVLACLSVIRARMLRADGRPLNELERSLSCEIVDPYLRRAAEKLDDEDQTPQRAEMVPIRPHPRTIPALSAIASAPGLNSGEVGREVGIENSGHVSGLLRRFERRGLIENAAPRQARSAERAWFLTPYGQRILRDPDQAL